MVSGFMIQASNSPIGKLASKIKTVSMISKLCIGIGSIPQKVPINMALEIDLRLTYQSVGFKALSPKIRMIFNLLTCSGEGSQDRKKRFAI